MDKYKIAIIGNSPISDVVSLLLGEKFEITRWKDTRKQPDYFPYFANDLKTGILENFIKKTNLQFVEECSPDLEICYNVDSIFSCHSNFQDFSVTLKSDFNEYIDELNIFLTDIERIGREWKQFIDNDFNSKRIGMIYSSKFFNKTLVNYLKKIGLYSSPIYQICQTILPISDVSFAVFSGYLYTQFLDNHFLKKNLIKELRVESSYKIKEKVVSELAKLNLKPIFQNDVYREKYNCIVDLRESFDNDFFKTENENVKQIAVLGEFILKERRLKPGKVYYFNKRDGVSLRIWSDLFDENDMKFQFEMFIDETLIFDISEIELRKLIFAKLKHDFNIPIESEKFLFYTPSQIKKFYDTNRGYMWAFSIEQTLLDPTFIFSKKQKGILKINYWGFAWFSAAFSIYNLILNSVDFSNNYYIYDGGKDR